MPDLSVLSTITVPPPGPRLVEFDPEALYVALDKRRRDLRISRRELLRQCGFGSPSLVTKLGQGHSIDARSLVVFLNWLGETDLKPYMRPAQHPEEKP